MRKGPISESREPQRPAAARASRLSTTATIANNRADTVAQLELIASVHASPYIQLQQDRLLGMFGGATQRKGLKEEKLQKKSSPSIAQLQPSAPSPRNSTGLPDGLKAGIESLSGVSMGNVKVHYNSAQPAQLNALAYAQGRDIHVAPGQQRHLPHEAWHVVQQAQGRVQPTMQTKTGVAVNDSAQLEREADVMGAKAARMSRHEEASRD